MDLCEQRGVRAHQYEGATNAHVSSLTSLGHGFRLAMPPA
jgi:hypothetical protein